MKTRRAESCDLRNASSAAARRPAAVPRRSPCASGSARG